MVRPTLEYGSEVWEGQAAASVESVMIGGAKRILGCWSRTCNERWGHYRVAEIRQS